MLNFLPPIADAAAQPVNNTWQTFIVLGVGLLLFYFFLIRPDQQRRKAIDAKRAVMKKGDTVIAIGFKGVVEEIREKTVLLNIASGQIEVLTAAISDVTPA